MRFVHLAPVVGALAILSGCTTTQQEYSAIQTALEGSPQIRRQVVAECAGDLGRQPSSEREVLAALANTSVGAMPRLVCSRVTNAWASGRLTFADVQSTQSGKPTPTAIRVIQGR